MPSRTSSKNLLIQQDIDVEQAQQLLVGHVANEVVDRLVNTLHAAANRLHRRSECWPER
ncbi:hypothetical protein [Rhodococcoides fascians]|uniref:hypothetical protein n=1 Tax=Rhodococcoides fascians TaxID=1828 RepID=UPI0012D2FCC0|nr:hypothetical protein [Rhodococcus fascians]